MAPEQDEPPATPEYPASSAAHPRIDPGDTPPCDICGGETWWRSCTLLCKQCRAIVMSCGDL